MNKNKAENIRQQEIDTAQKGLDKAKKTRDLASQLAGGAPKSEKFEAEILGKTLNSLYEEKEKKEKESVEEFAKSFTESIKKETAETKKDEESLEPPKSSEVSKKTKEPKKPASAIWSYAKLSMGVGGLAVGEIFKTAWKIVKLNSINIWRTALGKRSLSYNEIWREFFPKEEKK